MKKVIIVILTLVVVAGIGRALLKLPAVQDMVLDRGTAAIAQRVSDGFS